jgi:hypothetical protein
VFDLLKKRTFLLQIAAFFYFGIETGFFLTVYPTALAYTKRLKVPSRGLVLAYYAYANGVGEILGELRCLGTQASDPVFFRGDSNQSDQSAIRSMR